MKKTSVFVLVFLSIALAGIFFFRHLFVPDQKTLGTVIENRVDDNSRNISSEVISKSAEIFDETSSPLFLERVKPETSDADLLLPDLDSSDPMIRQAILSLTNFSVQEVEGLLPGDQLIRKFVAVLDSAAAGRFSLTLLGDLSIDGVFVAREIEDDVFEIDFRSYQRFNFVTDVFCSINAARAAELYRLAKPLINAAYKELGYLESDFDKIFFLALESILKTPDFPDRVLLKRPVVMYEYIDPKYEALNAFQKQILRTGPRNSALIKKKAREIEFALKNSQSQ
jgi:hypothetical protein